MSGWFKKNKFSNDYTGSDIFRAYKLVLVEIVDGDWIYSTPADGLRVHLNGSSLYGFQGYCKSIEIWYLVG